MTCSSAEQHQALAQDIIDTGEALATSGLGVGTSGNISVRIGSGFLITPSAVPYGELTPERIVLMSGGPESAPAEEKPSSEWRFHRAIYQARAGINAIVHTHPPYATALACNHKGIPSFHYMVAVAGGRDIPCAPYATFGTQLLSDHVVTALSERNACLLANHGMIALGADLGAAYALTEYVEDLAQQYHLALQLGDVKLLDECEMAEVLERFASTPSTRF